MGTGRPTKVNNWLTEDGLRLLTHYKRNDMSDEQIAKKIGISPSTFCDWKKRFPQISEALKKGLEFCICDAEEALIAKFKPCEYKETSVETWEEETPGKEKVVIKTHKKVISKTAMPDTAAIIFFLKAKAGWKENNEQQDNAALERLDAIIRDRQRNAIKQEAERIYREGDEAVES